MAVFECAATTGFESYQGPHPTHVAMRSDHETQAEARTGTVPMSARFSHWEMKSTTRERDPIAFPIHFATGSAVGDEQDDG